MHLFWEQGYEATGIAQLSEHLGIGRQSLYSTFGDKRALFEEALERYRNELLAQIVATLDAPGSGLANVHAVLDMWESHACGRNYIGCLLANSMAEFGNSDPDLGRLLRASLTRLTKGFERALTRARDAGELTNDADPHALARLLVTIGQGLAVAGKVSGPGYAREAIAAARRLLD